MENEISELKTQLTILERLKLSPEDTDTAPHLELIDFDKLSQTLSRAIEMLEKDREDMAAARIWFDKKIRGLHRAGLEMTLIAKDTALPDTASLSLAQSITHYENLKRTLSPSIGSTGLTGAIGPRARRPRDVIQYKS